MSNFRHRTHISSTGQAQGLRKGGKLVVREGSVPSKGFWQERDTAQPRHNRVAFLIDTKVAGVHARLDANKPLLRERDGIYAFPIVVKPVAPLFSDLMLVDDGCVRKYKY